MTEAQKAKMMHAALAKLHGEYRSEGRAAMAASLAENMASLEPASYAKLYDILTDD